VISQAKACAYRLSTRLVAAPFRVRKSLAPEQHKEQRQDNTNEQACSQREVKGKILAPDVNIARESANPGDLASQGKEEPHAGYNQAQHNKHLA